MNLFEIVLYTTNTHTAGGRDGAGDDCRLDVKLSSLRALGTATVSRVKQTPIGQLVYLQRR